MNTSPGAHQSEVHGQVAARIVAEGHAPVLDVGCGEGPLRQALPDGWPWFGLDIEAWEVIDVLADAVSLPMRDASVGAVAALWMLYQVADPALAVAEASRVLRPGGLFVACTTARDDSPELLAHLPPPPETTFDAEEAPAIVAGVFGDVELERWDAPLDHLPTRESGVGYLTDRSIGDELAEAVAAQVRFPVTVTRRGVLVWARR